MMMKKNKNLLLIIFRNSLKKCIYHKTIFQHLSIDFDHLKDVEEVQQWCVTVQQRYPDIFKVMKILQSQKMLHTSTPYYELDLSPIESLKIYFVLLLPQDKRVLTDIVLNASLAVKETGLG